MTEELKKKLLDFSNSREPFLTHNHMYTADIGDGSAAVVLPMCRDSLNRWGGAVSCSPCATWPWAWPS